MHDADSVDLERAYDVVRGIEAFFWWAGWQRIVTMSDAEVDAELRAEGFDPEEVACRTRATLRQALEKWRSRQ
jgi:hypothetical protein